jgi:hypothetical protein
VADQNAAVTRAFDVTATTPHLLGITPPAGAWRRGGIDGINCTTGDVTRHQTVAVRGSWHIAISITETMKRKAEIKFVATFVVTAELADAKWKKLVGDYLEPTGDWTEDLPSALDAWAETELNEVMSRLVLTKVPASLKMPLLAGNGDWDQEFQVEFLDAEYDGIELTDAL